MLNRMFVRLIIEYYSMPLLFVQKYVELDKIPTSTFKDLDDYLNYLQREGFEASRDHYAVSGFFRLFI